jgi:integrase
MGSWKVAWTRYRKQAGVTCRLHDLRHTFVSKLAEAQVADSTLMSVTGHISKRMLELYSHVRNQAKRDAIADAALSPLESGKISPQKSPQGEVSVLTVAGLTH